MFALVLEREPLTFKDLPPGLVSWVQDAGGFAAAGLALWLLLGLSRLRPSERARIPRWQSRLFVASAVLAALCYLVWGALFVTASLQAAHGEATRRAAEAYRSLGALASTFLTAGGAFAMLAVGLPFLRNLAQLRFRRIGALAKLSFKEAVRRRVLYVFSLFLLVILFGSWFVPSKPSDQVRTYVQVVDWATTALLLFTAVLLAAFSIPTDVKQQTIHTIVTKPVERFEVILGRFLGFFALMTLVLLFMTAVSLLYVVRGVNPEAAAESLKARVPVYGELEFENTPDRKKATNVGREWDYRSHVTGSRGDRQRTARRDFASLPPGLSGRDPVRREFSFDVYRTTKGQENRGVPCFFAFSTRNYEPGNDKKYRQARR